ncbi:hypothetical protein C2E23DRAFT_562541 [Lenzites betulinus]|nr:hypothetical protein C2E23DRAFT_562541 [Lenzites betulinus]
MPPPLGCRTALIASQNSSWTSPRGADPLVSFWWQQRLFKFGCCPTLALELCQHSGNQRRTARPSRSKISCNYVRLARRSPNAWGTSLARHARSPSLLVSLPLPLQPFPSPASFQLVCCRLQKWRATRQPPRCAGWGRSGRHTRYIFVLDENLGCPRRNSKESRQRATRLGRRCASTARQGKRRRHTTSLVVAGRDYGPVRSILHASAALYKLPWRLCEWVVGRNIPAMHPRCTS